MVYPMPWQQKGEIMDLIILLISMSLTLAGCAYMVISGIADANDQLDRIERLKNELLKGVIE